MSARPRDWLQTLLAITLAGLLGTVPRDSVYGAHHKRVSSGSHRAKCGLEQKPRDTICVAVVPMTNRLVLAARVTQSTSSGALPQRIPRSSKLYVDTMPSVSTETCARAAEAS